MLGTLETNSLMVYNFVNGFWEAPWNVSMKIITIIEMRRSKDIEVNHIMEEGNKVVDFFTNIIFSFAGTNSIIFQSLQQVQKEGRTLLAMDKNQVRTY